MRFLLLLGAMMSTASAAGPLFTLASVFGNGMVLVRAPLKPQYVFIACACFAKAQPCGVGTRTPAKPSAAWYNHSLSGHRPRVRGGSVTLWWCGS